MKQTKLFKGLLVVVLLLSSLYANAYDFSAKNDDGVTIYYNIVSSSKRTCEVSHHTSLIFYSGSVTIPETVTYSGKTYTVIGIGHWAFGYSEELTDVKIPSTITYIDGLGFHDCSSLPSVDIPNSVTRIGDCAFEDCESLTSVDIPNGVTEIGVQTFYGCKSLVSIKIPDSVTAIWDSAFNFCSSLKSVYSLNPEPPVSRGNAFSFGVDKETCTIYVPKGSKDAYSTAIDWKDFLNIVEMDMTGIESVITSSEDIEVVGYYTIDGKAVDTPQRGVNIVKYSDGSTKKILVQ